MVGLNDAQAAAAPANVIALARTDSRKELAELYTRADVFVIPLQNLFCFRITSYNVCYTKLLRVFPV